MSTSVSEASGATIGPSTIPVSRLLVTRRDPATSAYRAVGILAHLERRYEFAYLQKAVEGRGFSPLPGLSATRRYISSTLFPVFASRVMSANRPDRAKSLKAVGLGPDAEPFEILGRTGGRRVGDEIELIPLPEPDLSGRMDVRFLVHGIRHRPQSAMSALDAVARGERLRLDPEPGNEHDPSAVRVETVTGVHLGYVPMPLSDFVTQALDAGDAPFAEVECRNGPEVGFHLRLLVRFRASTSGDCWSGPDWELVD